MRVRQVSNQFFCIRFSSSFHLATTFSPVRMVKIADRAIWGAGPVFVVLAVALIDMCVLAYYLVVFPANHDVSLLYEASALDTINMIFTILFTLYMIYCIHFHYYKSIMTAPGSMDPPRSRSSLQVRYLVS